MSVTGAAKETQSVIMNNLTLIRKLIDQVSQVRSLSAGCCILCGGVAQAPCCTACLHDLVPWNHESLGFDRVLASEVPTTIDQILVAYEFVYPMTHLIHAYKYQHHLSLAKWFAEQIFPCAHRAMAENAFDLVLAMPLHPLRLWERGFNQSHEIAKYLAVLLGIPCKTQDCQRLFHLPPQVELNVEARQRLPERLFDCCLDLEAKHVLLVDDVMTTGMSLLRLAQAIKRQGAERITTCVVARVPDVQQ